MAAPLHVLLVAHADTAGGRFLSALKAAGYAPKAALAATEEALAAALEHQRWDVVVIVPGPTAIASIIDAVRLAQPNVPVVVAEAPAGAEPRLRGVGADAVVPAGSLDRLGDAVARVLAAAASPPAGARLGTDPRALAVQDLAEHLPIGLYQSTPDGRILYANEALAVVLGFDRLEDLADVDVRRDIGYPREHFEAQMARFGAVRNLVVRWTDRRGRAVYTRENARVVRDASGGVSYFEGTMEDVTAERSAYERDRRRTEQLAAVVRFATAVDDAETVEDVYATAVSAAEEVTGAPRVALVLADNGGVRCAAVTAAISAEGLALAAEGGVFDALPLGEVALILPDVNAEAASALDPGVRAFLVERGVGALAVYPLIHHGSVHGAFFACYDEPRAISDEDVQVAQTLAWHVAGALARHIAEADLRDSEACLRFIDRHTDHVLFRLRYDADTPGGAFDYLSPAVEALVGFTPEELEAAGGLGTLVDAREVLEGEGLMDGPPAPEAMEGDGTPPRYVARYRMRTRAGESRWVENVAYVWTDAAGRPVGLVGTLLDVTERKRREEERAAGAARTLDLQKTLVELGGLGDVESEAFVRRATEVAAAVIGVERALVRVETAAGDGACLDRFEGGAHGDDPLMAASQFGPWLREHEHRRSIAVADVEIDPRAAAAGAGPYLRSRGVGALLTAAIRRHGRVAGVLSLHHVGGPRLWTAAEQEFAAALADLLALALERSERLRAEGALRDQELRYRAVSELTTDYAFAVRIHPDGRDELVWATGAFSRVTGYAPEEVEGVAGLLSLFEPECAPRVRDALRQLADGEAVDFEGRLRTKDGDIRWVRHRARPGEPASDGTLVHYHGGEDVTERKSFEQELIAAREEAEEMARLKSAFLANMSHEIRTPLTAILGYAGLLAEEVTDPEHRESVEFIERSGHRLLDTLNSVLELARLEASGVRPLLEVLDVAAEARQSARLLAPLAEGKGLHLDVVAPNVPVNVRIDRTCLARILNNLIGNAVKFTEEGRVSVEVRIDHAHAHVRITDTGVGIDPGFLPRIFDEFRQESDGDARNHEGAGLGLAITRRLVDLMGGAVAVESKKGAGTAFTVTFPLHEATADDPAVEAPAAEAPAAEAPAAALVHTPGPAAVWSIVEAAPADAPDADAVSDRAVEAPAAGPAIAGQEPPAAAPAPLLDLIYPPDDTEMDDDFLLAWADEPAAHPAPPEPPLFDVADEAWTVDTDLDAIFEGDVSYAEAPASGDGRGSAERWLTGLAVPGPDDLELVAVPRPLTPPLPPTTMDAVFSEETGSGTPTPAPPPAVDPRPTVQGPTVLVVEDNADTRALLERILRPGYTTFAVGDARSALDLLHRQRFDAIVLDINLGGRETGVDVLRIARALPGNEALFAVALTAYALPGDRERFLEAGFDQYVSKPFTRSTLMGALREGAHAA